MPRPLTIAAAALLLIGSVALIGSRFGTEQGGECDDANASPASDALDAAQRELAARDTRIAELEAALDEEPEPANESAPPTAPPVSKSTLRRLETVAKIEPTSEHADTLAGYAAAIRASGERMIAGAEAAARAEVMKELVAENESLLVLGAEGPGPWLRALDREFVPPWQLLYDAARYAKLFERRAKGPSLDGPTFRKDSLLADGSSIVYPAGVHAVDTEVFDRRSPFPTDILIVGQGMDETLLHLRSELRMRGEVERLTFRDLTIDTGDNFLEALRDGPYTLRLERCRVIGFDMGAGGSKMLGGSVGAFYASHCRIEAGFGRSPGGGNLFDVRGALVARLEDCVIVGPFSSVYYQWPGAAHVFERCRFERLDDRMRGHIESPPAPVVRFTDCTFDYMAPGQKIPRTRRSWTEINPGWRK